MELFESGSYIKEIENGKQDQIATFLKININCTENEKMLTEDEWTVWWEKILREGIPDYEKEFLLTFGKTGETMINDFFQTYNKETPISTVDVGFRLAVKDISEKLLFIERKSAVFGVLEEMHKLGPELVTAILGSQNTTRPLEKDHVLQIIDFFKDQYTRLECPTILTNINKLREIIESIITIEIEES